MADSAIRSTEETKYPGIAAEDIASDSIELKVISHALTPGALSGTIGAGITNQNVSLKDKDGGTITSTATTANHIVATWEGESNKRSPPLIRKGEPVEVFKIADQDKFYWRATGRGRDFRTVDRLHMEIGATDPTKPGQTKDDKNTYSTYMDSEKQIIGFKTSAVNGEAMALTCHADLKSGTFILTDDSASPANRIFLDSGKISGTPQLQLNISSGVTIKMNGKDLLIKVPGKFLVQSDERIVFDSPLTVFNIGKKGSFIVNAANVAINTAASMIISAGSVFGVNAAASKIAGFFVAGASRLVSATKGPVGGDYTPVTIGDPLKGSVSTPSNNADTNPGANEF